MARFAPLNDEDREKLIAFLDGELDEKSAHDWEVRLSRDALARTEAESLRHTWELLDYLPQPEPSANFTSRTLERISVLRPAASGPKTRRHWQPWALGIGWAAAILLAGLAGLAGVSRLLPARETPVAEATEPDRYLARDLRIIENFRLYEHVDDLNFLRRLADDPDLFGDESP
jgi:anti-sigma factor RsiW